jgi:hypothetical protein
VKTAIHSKVALRTRPARESTVLTGQGSQSGSRLPGARARLWLAAAAVIGDCVYHRRTCDPSSTVPLVALAFSRRISRAGFPALDSPRWIPQEKNVPPLTAPTTGTHRFFSGMQSPATLKIRSRARPRHGLTSVKDFDFSNARFIVCSTHRAGACRSFRKQHKILWTTPCVMLHDSQGRRPTHPGARRLRQRPVLIDPVAVDDVDRRTLLRLDSRPTLSP